MGYESKDYDNSIEPEKQTSGTIVVKEYHYKVKAPQGKWKTFLICYNGKEVFYIVCHESQDVNKIYSNIEKEENIVSVNRYDWSYAMCDDESEENFVAECCFLVDPGYYSLFQQKVKEIDAKESISLDNYGVYLSSVDKIEYEHAWMIFNDEEKLVAFVYEGFDGIEETILM